MRNRISPIPPPRPRRGDPAHWRNYTAGDVADYGYKAYQMAKSIVRLINVEEKVFDVDGTASATTLTTTPTVVNLSNIAQGTDYFNRVGNSIKPLSIRIAWSSMGSNAAAYNRMRLMVVQDKENQGVDPTLGEVLAGLSQPILAPMNPETGRRFKVLLDTSEAYTNLVGPTTSGTSAGYNPELKPDQSITVKLGGHIYYDDTAGADASNLEGAIFLMAVSLDASTGPTMRYATRIIFTDN